MYFFQPDEKAFNYGSSIWPVSVEVSDEVYAQLMTSLNNGYTLSVDVEGFPIAVAPTEPLPINIVDRFKERLSILNGDYESAVAYLKSTYPPSEVDTWTIQITEARAIYKWLEENPTLTIDDMPDTVAPFLISLSASRIALGYPNGLEHLIQRVIENNALFTPALSQVTALRHATERQMLLAVGGEDLVALNSVTWTFPFPPVLVE